MWKLPFEFEPDAYRGCNADLVSLDDDELVEHYNQWGKREGLACNRLAGRGDFAALIPPAASALEIGPFASPVLSGPHIRYCDVLDTAQLKQRAPQHGMDPARVPNIDYVMKNGSLDGITARFDAILSSHAIEHQPNLIDHLSQIERRLKEDGRYFVLVPDKRYCFDRNIAPSTIAEIVQAHVDKRTRHTLRSVIEHRAFMVHNDPYLHWNAGRSPNYSSGDVDPAKVRGAIAEYEVAAGSYIDVHAWYFTPDSFRSIMSLLLALDLTRLRVERLYRTRRNSVEFWAVMTQVPQPPGPYDETTGEDEPEFSTPVQPVDSMVKTRPGLLARTVQMIIGRH